MSSSTRNLVVGVDASETSKKALDYTLQHQARPGDNVHVLYCYEPLMSYVGPEFSRTPTSDQEKAWEAAEKAKFDKFMSEANAPDGVTVTPHIRAGDPRSEISSLAEQQDAAGVTVGSHGKNLLKRALLGSVSSHLAQQCNRPLTIVPNKSS